MDNVKVHTTLAGHSFTAEGPQEVVQEQFKAWLQQVKELAAVTPSVDTSGAGNGSNGAKSKSEAATSVPDQKQLSAVFNQENRNGKPLVTLRYPPQGNNRAEVALVLLLFGFRELAKQEEVPVMTLKDALEQSGLRIERVDRTAYLPIKEGLVLKGGKKGPGGSYRLTNAGLTRAVADLRELLQQI